MFDTLAPYAWGVQFCMNDPIIRNHYGLSPQFGEVTEWLMSQDMSSHGLDFGASGLPGFLANYM